MWPRAHPSLPDDDGDSCTGKQHVRPAGARHRKKNKLLGGRGMMIMTMLCDPHPDIFYTEIAAAGDFLRLRKLQTESHEARLTGRPGHRLSLSGPRKKPQR
ncbi:hypothetical protein BV898_11053 [Hypsibius exemplaris]|uniref:Uncharacterized protein n=1 Tax=Hypsibius exemplaris TaxID=2072580 RepID=A0A1W0WHV1_HYPEX|nr:hypothetical protein BV898_11053 [Hypsibius exemplaris]